MAGNWTSYGYLANTSGIFSGFYQFLASSPLLLKTVDLLNMYGLTIIGVALFTGWAVRYAAAAGTALLALYYFAYPPVGFSLFRPADGHLFIVDKNVIEAVALLYLAFTRIRGYGIDTLIRVVKDSKTATPDNAQGKLQEETVNTRREALKNLATIPVLGLMGVSALQVHKELEVDVMSGATIQLKSAALSELKGTLAKGKLGNHEISRLVMGGNLIGGWAHARDLLYAPSLFKAYNTEKKVYETLMLAENAGINSINIGFPSFPLMVKYKKLTGRK